MRSNRKRSRITLLVMLLLFISLGYAFVSTNLKIDGLAIVKKQTWDVHFENIKVKRGSITPIHEALINVENKTQVSYEVKLDNPGDFYEFEVDVVNAGTMDAMVTEILSTNNNQPISLPSYMEYKVTYKDGREIKTNHLLKSTEKETYKVGIYFKSDIDPSELTNSQPLNLRLKFEVTYGQKTNDAYERDITMFLTGKEVNVKMKELAGDTGATHTTIDTNITAIKHSETEPTSENKQTNNIVSTEDSTHPIYMWFDNGTIYWWSEDPHPSLNPDASNMFRDLRELIDISGLENFDTSKVENMQTLFANDIVLSNINPIRNWDISNVEILIATFQGCIELTDLTPISNWDMSKVETMCAMFQGTSSVGNMKIHDLAPLRNWNTSNVTNMQAMFQRCSNITNINALANWDTSSVETMYGMFVQNANLINVDGLKNWDTSSLKITSGMFSGCRNLMVIDITNFHTDKITNSDGMFNGCTNLTTIYGNESFNTELNTTSTDMFTGCTSLVGGGPTPFDSTHTDKEYARVGTSELPGYFTRKD